MSESKDLRWVAQCNLPTRYGVFTMHGFQDPRSGQEHMALVAGDPAKAADSVLVRVHSECLTGDTLGSQRCDCGAQLQSALQAIQAEGCGMVVYLRQEGRGIGLLNKIRAYALQDQGMDTVEANIALGLPVDARDFALVGDVFRYFHLRRVRLMTNNPYKIQVLRDGGFEVEAVPLYVGQCPENHHYLTVKKEKLGHLLPG